MPMLDASGEVVPNLGAGFATFVGVYEDYYIAAGQLRPKSLTLVRRYAPARHPEILGELAKLPRGDVDALLRFARLYGTLGYQAFIPREVWARGDGIPVGDPLVWIWMHARTLLICLELSHLLQEGDVASLRTYLRSMRLTDQDKEEWGAIHASASSWVRDNKPPIALVAIQGRFTIREWMGSVASDQDVKDLAREIRRSLINDNIAGIHRTLLDDGKKDSLFWEFKALIEMAYWHLANAVDGRRFQRCEADDCGALFVQTDPRQRYCPPLFGQKQESRCAVRRRVHKHRQKDLR
jgi:CGNR zinc finger